MKKKMINKVYLEGRLYQHNLEMRKSGPSSKNPGTQYISGTVDVATDEDITNIVTVNYTYVTAKYGSGKDNPNFKFLSDIIDGKYLTCMANGSDVATKIRIDTAIGVNDYYTDKEKEEDGSPKLITYKRNEGGFISAISSLKPDEKNARDYFDVDMVITGFTIKEADEEKGYPEKGILKGCIFDFRNACLPVEFSVLNPNAISYFEGLDASAKNPVFTRIKGTEVSEVVKKTITIAGAFGDEVREVNNNHRDWVVTWAQTDPYEWDNEDTITAADLKKAMTDRQTVLAEIKARYEEYKKNQGTTSAPASNAADTFEF